MNIVLHLSGSKQNVREANSIHTNNEILIRKINYIMSGRHVVLRYLRLIIVSNSF